ncbi:hypothetical protein BMA10399_B2180 [Burkholderia mallei ATCC 10399]|nr:hypothetical protein BMA10399_B2180 [Burkholderia mallei ATCC 10399]
MSPGSATAADACAARGASIGVGRHEPAAVRRPMQAAIATNPRAADWRRPRLLTNPTFL